MSKNTFNVPYLFNPGILAGRLPNHLLKKVKKAVNDPSARQNRAMTKDLVGSIREEYLTPEVPGLREYLHDMYDAWKNLYKTPDVPYRLDPIWTNYMKAGEFNPNHTHPNALAVFVIWITYQVVQRIIFRNNTGEAGNASVAVLLSAIILCMGILIQESANPIMNAFRLFLNQDLSYQAIFLKH
jgi:hypothetical protein